MIKYKFQNMTELFDREVFDGVDEAEKLGLLTTDQANDLNHFKGIGMNYLNSFKKKETYICEICGEPIESKRDQAVYAMPDGLDDFTPEPAHSWCVDHLEEQHITKGEENDF
jgi:hypothetical protein